MLCISCHTYHTNDTMTSTFLTMLYKHIHHLLFNLFFSDLSQTQNPIYCLSVSLRIMLKQETGRKLHIAVCSIQRGKRLMALEPQHN